MKLFKIKSNKRIKNNTGFSVIESLVAITILLIATAAPLTLATQSLSASFLARDQITASFLAQEGIELVRNVRDTNVLENVSWFEDLSLSGNGTGNPCFNAPGCRIDVVSPSVVSNCPSGCPALKYDALSKRYSYTLGVDSMFTRTILITKQGGIDYEMKVESKVEWVHRDVTHDVTVEEVMFNWACVFSSCP